MEEDDDDDDPRSIFWAEGPVPSPRMGMLHLHRNSGVGVAQSAAMMAGNGFMRPAGGVGVGRAVSSDIMTPENGDVGANSSTPPTEHEQLGVTPDVFTSAKALGGGVPIGAMMARGDAAERARCSGQRAGTRRAAGERVDRHCGTLSHGAGGGARLGTAQGSDDEGGCGMHGGRARASENV